MHNAIVRSAAALILIALLATIGGCGKKGALYLPQKDADPQKTTAPK